MLGRRHQSRLGSNVGEGEGVVGGHGRGVRYQWLARADENTTGVGMQKRGVDMDGEWYSSA